MKNVLFTAICSMLMVQCNAVSFTGETQSPSHETWNNLLRKHVTADGKVNYQGFIKDSLELNNYLERLAGNPPNEKTWTANQQKAYWINAYNAFTVKLIVNHYPVKSINDIGSKIQTTKTPFDIPFITIGNEKMSLNAIEHEQLGKKFNDPRIHFAITCASRSCPALLNAAYTADQLDEQLDKQARAFLADKSRNKISADKVQLSKIFDWYNSDFTQNGTLIDFLNPYAPAKISRSARITYLDYDWSLNE